MKITTLLTVLAALVLSGCGGGRNWREEVRMADGKTIVVQRIAKLGNPLDQEIPDLKYGPPTVGHRIRIPVPDRGSVVWETDKTLTPLAIGLRGETVFLAASPRFCWAYEQLGRPVPPYVFFKHEGKDWQRIPVEEFPAEIDAANLSVAARPEDAESGYVTADAVKRINNSLPSHSRTIYRSGVKGWEQCVREANAGWYKANSYRDQN
jgi:hypothetical protein